MRVLIAAIFLIFALASIGTVTAINAGNSSDRTIRRLEAQVAQEKHDATAAVAANQQARQDDCAAMNRTRRALRQIATTNLQSLGLTRSLFPNIPESLIRKAAFKYRQQIRTFAHRDCARYARRALP